MHDLQIKTGLPFFDYQQAIRESDRGCLYDAQKDMEGLFEGLTIKPKDILNNDEAEKRIAEYIAVGLKPEGISPDEIKLAERIQQTFKGYENLVKRVRHWRFMKTGEKPNNWTSDELMEEGRKIFEDKGVKAWEKWIDEQDFGLRKRYVPWLHESEFRVDPDEPELFGRGFTHTRETKKGNNEPTITDNPYTHVDKYDIIGSTYRYILRAKRIERVEPLAVQLKSMFEDPELKWNNDINKTGLIHRYFNTIFAHVEAKDDFQKVPSNMMGQFFRVTIPANIIKWSVRDLMQNLAIALPKSMNPTDPIWWKNVHRLYSHSGNLLIDIRKSFKDDKLNKLFEDPEVNEYFLKNVVQLDSIMENYTNQELNEWERGAGGTIRNTMAFIDKIGHIYSLVDKTNRTGTFSCGYHATKDGIERYRKEPTEENLSRLMDLSTMIYAPEFTQKEFLYNLRKGKDKKAAMLAGKVFSDTTNYLYHRGDKGLAWMKMGVGGDLLAPIATYPKGGIQEMARSCIGPMLDYWKAEYEHKVHGKTKPSAWQKHRAFKGLMYMTYFYLTGELANTIWYMLADDDRKIYGISSLLYMPFGGPILSLLGRLYSIGSDVSRGKATASTASQAINDMSNATIPFYKLLNKSIAVYSDQDNFTIPGEIVRQIERDSKYKFDRRTWSKRDMLEKSQKLFFDGGYRPEKEQVVRAYMDYEFAKTADEKQGKREDLEKLLRKYPVSTKRKGIDRKAENTIKLIPDIYEYSNNGEKKKKENKEKMPPRPPR
jgi:hypothetical protein